MFALLMPGHGQKEDRVDGKLKYLQEPYLHFGFSKGWSQWLERHNKYSTQEAETRIAKRRKFKEIFSPHASARNTALKYFLSRVPGWPVLRFLNAYIFNVGFLEGRAGLIYCIQTAYYEFLIQLKMRELRCKKQ